MAADNPAEIFIDEEFPSTIRPLIPSALRRAYATADRTIDQNVYLSTPGGQYQRGDLIMLAVSFELERLVKTGDLPFDGSWENYARPTGKHFVIRTNRALITANQVEDASKKPRKAVFRANFEESNQSLLFEDDEAERRRKIEQAILDGERRSLHILHGYQDLNFAHIAYPSPDKNGHIFRTNNLMRLPHVAIGMLTPPEGPTESPDPEIIESIERHFRDND
ncbi:hypothetical protein [Methylobacterium sp. WL120]|uniref:hypothetical protein n=1 Tax=Methylobacterium sp. WL120 TaxID=2603887 RepID=UPI0011C80770|nr:hypothetical protein [Methylobacterium sp. WL120]TXM70180.1 hypothetical protein FV229_03165 [Methylobacterium sp. WL120]TXN13786.1 hypothetical protein FV219_04490 [Methylobacterium sp. WL122]